jgi:hypothetical protein
VSVITLADIEERYRQAAERYDRLFLQALSRAFDGDVVPQAEVDRLDAEVTEAEQDWRHWDALRREQTKGA